MKVTLEKHGGLAAGICQPPCIVECSALPVGQRMEVSRLVAELKKAPPLETENPGRMRDAMTFSISVEGDCQVEVYRQVDLHMSEPFANLLAWLERHSASTRT